MRGFFRLNEPEDLLAKLKSDFNRIMAAPSDPYPAFDFFVTAEHLLDWLYPGKEGQQQRTARREAEPLLQIVSHIAAGAKHRNPEASRHKSVERAEAVGTPYSNSAYGADTDGPGPLVVHLDENTTARLGISSITTAGLAHRILEYWTNNMRR